MSQIRALKSLLILKRESLERLKRIQQVENKSGKVSGLSLDPGQKINPDDYYVPRHYFYDTGANATKAMLELQLSDSQIKLKHPLEHTNKTQIGAYMEDYLSRRPERSAVFQNVPHDLWVESDLTPYLKQVGALDESFGKEGVKVRYDMKGVPALVEVMFQEESGARRAVKEINKTTVRGYTLFVKTREHAEEESAQARTVYLSGLGPWVKREDVLEFLSQYGHVLGMDFPMVDGEIEAKFKTMQSEEKWKEELSQATNLSQLLDTLLKEHHINAANKEQTEHQARLISQFFEVEDQIGEEAFKEVVKELKQLKQDDLEVEATQAKLTRELEKGNVLGETDEIQLERIREIVNEKQIQKILAKMEREEGIENLEEMQSKQLSETYAGLLKELKASRVMIEKRMERVLKGHGIMDKVLIQSRNHELDPDSISNETDQKWFKHQEYEQAYRKEYHTRLKMEDFLTIEEQRVMIERFKQISPFQRWKTYHEYKDKGKGMMMKYMSPNFERNLVIQKVLRKPAMLKYRGYRGMKEFEGKKAGFDSQGLATFSPEAPELYAYLDGYMKEAMKDYSPSFDAIYSREKEAVIEYVEAATHLRNMRLAQKHNEFLKDYRIKEQLAYEKKLKSGLLSGSKESIAMLEVYAAGDQSKIEEKEIELEESRAVNMGYCFVTFASADEARLAVLAGMDDTQARNHFSQKLEIGFKGYKGHGDLDPVYSMAMIKRDSRLLSEMARLRKKKRELEKVESEIERRDRYGNVFNQGKFYQALNQTEQEPIYRLPHERGSLLERPWNRLQEWRFWAKSHFDSAHYRDPEYNPYSRQEQDRLRKKIKQFERLQGKINLGEVFGSPVQQQLEYEKHRLAFQAYKHFAFLKRGLNPEQHKTKTQPKNKDYYSKHPAPQELLRLLFSKNNQTKLLWKSATSEEKPGRSFKDQKTNEELLMEYLGDDLLRIPELDTPENKNLFRHFEDMRRMFPEQSRLQRRRQQESYRAELLEEDNFLPYTGSQDPEIARYLEEKEHFGQEITPQVLRNETIRDHTESKVIKGMDSYPAPDVYRALYNDLIKQKRADKIPYYVELPFENKLRELARMYRVVYPERELQPAPRVGFVKEKIKPKNSTEQALNIQRRHQFRQFEATEEEDAWYLRVSEDDAEKSVHQFKRGKEEESRRIKLYKSEWISKTYEESQPKEPKFEFTESLGIPSLGKDEPEQGEEDMRYEPYLRKFSTSKPDQEALSVHGSEFPLEKPNPEYKDYSYRMQKLLTEIEHSLSGDLDLSRKKLMTKQEQVKQVRLKSEGDALHNRDGYFKAKELTDPSSLEKYVPREIKEQFEHRKGVRELMQRQGYLDDYKIDHMTDEDYRKYVESWADSQLKRTTIYQNEAYGSQEMLELEKKFADAARVQKYEELEDERAEYQKLEEFGNQDIIGDRGLYASYQKRLEEVRVRKENERGLSREKTEEKVDELKQGMRSKVSELESGVIPSIEEYYRRKQENRPILGKQAKLEENFHQSHFRADSGKHARGAWDPEFKGTNLEDELIDDFDMTEHEWLARVYSGQMSAEQFGLLQNEKQKTWARERDQIEELEAPSVLRYKYMNGDDVLRIYDTLRERMVYEIMESGEIVVEESNHPAESKVREFRVREEAERRLNDAIKGNIANYFFKEKQKKKLGELKDYELFMLDPRRNYQTREYYFDANLGVSLEGHIQEIKQNAPEIKVETREDEHGFTIVQLSLKKQYKYDLDEMVDKLSSRPDLHQDQAIQNWMEGLVDANSDVPLRQQMAHKLEKYSILTVHQGVLGMQQVRELDQIIKRKLEGSVDATSFLEKLSELSQGLSQDQVRESDALMNEKPAIKYTLSHEERVEEKKRKARELFEQIMLRYQYERESRPLRDHDFIRGKFRNELEKGNELEECSLQTRALDWQLEDDQDMMRYYEEQRKTKPEGPVDSIFYKNKLTETSYSEIKERVRRARERREKMRVEGLGEVKNYYRP